MARSCAVGAAARRRNSPASIARKTVETIDIRRQRGCGSSRASVKLRHCDGLLARNRLVSQDRATSIDDGRIIPALELWRRATLPTRPCVALRPDVIAGRTINRRIGRFLDDLPDVHDCTSSRKVLARCARVDAARQTAADHFISNRTFRRFAGNDVASGGIASRYPSCCGDLQRETDQTFRLAVRDRGRATAIRATTTAAAPSTSHFAALPLRQ